VSCSDILREKALACNLLFCCAVQFKEFFFIWVNQVSCELVMHSIWIFPKDFDLNYGRYNLM
jgi:hypothetical protein